MILRRITEHVRAQNWTAVGLDFLIVVVGVFIGLQVSNWNDARSDRARAALILEDIAADLRADTEEIQNTLRAAEERFAASDVILDRAIGWQSPTTIPTLDGEYLPLDAARMEHDWAASHAIAYAVRYTTFDTERHAYDGLVASGDILLLSDSGLIESLRAHYARVDGFNDVEDHHYRLSVNRMRAQFMDAGIGRLDTLEWAALEAAVADNPGLAGALKWVNSDSLHQIRALRELRAETEALIAQVEGTRP